MVNSFSERHKYDITDIPDFEEIYLDKLLVESSPENMNFYARVLLKPGMEVHRHQHIGESESYFILSGIGLFDDNGYKDCHLAVFIYELDKRWRRRIL